MLETEQTLKNWTIFKKLITFSSDLKISIQRYPTYEFVTRNIIQNIRNLFFTCHGGSVGWVVTHTTIAHQMFFILSSNLDLVKRIKRLKQHRLLKTHYIQMEAKNGTHKLKYSDQQFKADVVILMLASKPRDSVRVWIKSYLLYRS